MGWCSFSFSFSAIGLARELALVADPLPLATIWLTSGQLCSSRAPLLVDLSPVVVVAGSTTGIGT